MKLHFTPFVPFCALLLLTFSASLTAAYPTCSLDNFRNRCGPEGVSELLCLEHNCCWHADADDNEPQCYHRNSGYKYFSFTANRIDCGWDGFTVSECLAVGCFHNGSPVGPSCFFPNTNIDPALCGLFADRIRCGDGFTRQEKCESLGCCWSPMPEGSKEPWCFFPPKDLSRKTFPHSKKKSKAKAASR